MGVPKLLASLGDLSPLFLGLTLPQKSTTTLPTLAASPIRCRGRRSNTARSKRAKSKGLTPGKQGNSPRCLVS